MGFKHIIAIISLSAVAVACNYLDFDETAGRNNKEDMYRYFDRVNQMLTHVYSFMPQCASFTGAGLDVLSLRDCASDDGEYGAVAATIQNVNNGNWSATSTYDEAWTLYNGIRAANSFIEEVEHVDLSRYENQSNYQNWMESLRYFPYEARVLRAYYFFELARRYGDIAMPLTVLTVEEANTIGKTPFAEVIDFIVKECDEAAKNLPTDFLAVGGNNNTGRTTKGFAMALKTKALLYAASPLHNPSDDAEAWKAAARAALEVINLNLYRLDANGCYTDPLNSKELVLARMNTENASYELYNFPLRLAYGNRTQALLACGNYPSQNLVDAFETVNGYSVTLGASGWECADPAFDPQHPYDGRDPRFARTVLADGATFKGITVDVSTDGNDNVPVAQGGSATGYFLRKYIQENTSFEPNRTATQRHQWILYRYAETLLSYAEAMVNAFGSGDYRDGEFTLSALEALNQVRANAGMPDITDTDKEALLSRIRNEWRVEFAFEDHRFWDVRRWKIGDATQRQLYGVHIVRRTNGEKVYTRTLYETRAWSERMNLYPIPQRELFNNDNLNPQNAGW